MKEFQAQKIKTAPLSVHEADQFVMGRDQLVEDLWQHLRRSSLRVLAERRMGKTWSLKLALARTPDWALPLFVDVEDCASAQAFVWKLNKELHASGIIDEHWWSQTQDWFRIWTQRLQGSTVGDYTLPPTLDNWDTFLEDTCSNWMDQRQGRMPIIVVDELPFMIDKITKQESTAEAGALLDKLRALRHQFPDLRMVFCGSLGLHIVLGQLRDQRYAGRPVNDMAPFEVPPLSPKWALQLAGGLLVGESIPCAKIRGVAEVVAVESSRVPFYIQKIISWMCDHPSDCWTAEDVPRVLAKIFHDSGNYGEFNYYEERLSQYYTTDIVELALACLDAISRQKHGWKFETLLNLIRHRPTTMEVTGEALLSTLRTLRDDHYLVHEDDHWRFKLGIVRAWWFETRGKLGL